jgi:hypothetical protein
VSLILYGIVAIAGAAILFFLFARFVPSGEQIAPPLRDEPLWLAPAGQRILAEDVENLRLPVALRGYRFAETDRLLDRLASELRERDAEIARLKSGGAPGNEAGGTPGNEGVAAGGVAAGGESETAPHSS